MKEAAALLSLLGVVIGIFIFGSAQAETRSSAQSASHVCMQRVTTGRLGGDGVFAAIVNPSRQKSFQANGFSVVACNGKLSARANYRAQMCGLANKAPKSIKDNFSSVHGVSPIELCQASR